MALTDLTAAISAAIHLEIAKVDGTGVSQDTLDIGRAISLLFGNGAGKADQVWYDRREIAISGDDDLDLSGVLKNAFGESIAFGTIRAILVINQSDVVWGTHTVATTASIKVGGFGANAFLGPFDANSDFVWLTVGNIFLITESSVSGWTVINATEDILRITNSSGSAKALYDIVLIGEEA